MLKRGLSRDSLDRKAKKTKEIPGKPDSVTRIQPKGSDKSSDVSSSCGFNKDTQLAVDKFKKATNEELYKLTREEGLDLQTAINQVVGKLR